jgi:hypothetical protein
MRLVVRLLGISAKKSKKSRRKESREDCVNMGVASQPNIQQADP